MKETEEQKSRELQAANQQLQASEQQLRAANQQLQASEQQLQAANQQLRAQEQQLRATNQQLEAYAQELKLSEAKFRSYIEKAPDGVFIVDENGTYLEVNPAACKITGYTAEELRDMHISDLIPDSDKEKTRKNFQHVKEKGFSEHEVGLMTKDGEFRYWHVAAQKLSETRYIGYAKDITERRKSETLIKEKNELLRATGEMAKVGGWELDVAQQKVSWTEETFRIHEVPPGEQPDLKDAISFFHPEDRPVLSKAIEKAIQEGKPYDLFIRLITAKGKQKFTHTLCRPHMENGKVIKLNGTFQDITELKKTEEAHHTLLLKYKTLFDSIPIGVTISDKKGNILESNKIAERLLGLSLEKQKERTIDGKEWRVIRTDGSPMPAEEFASVRALKENRLIENVEMGIVKSAEETSWINVSAIPIPLSDGGVLIAYSDISDRIEADQKLELYKERLELAMDAGNHGFWDWDMETNETFFSPRYYTMLGYAYGELPMNFETWEKLLHPDDKKTVTPLIMKKVTNAQPYEVEFRLRCKDGTYKWISGQGKGYKKSKDGKPYRAVGLHIDISERKLAEQELHRTQKEVQTWINSSPVCTKKIDLDFNLQYMSQAGIEQLKVKDVEALYGHPYPFYFFPEEFQKKMSENLQKVKETKKSLKMDGILSDMEGNRLWYQHNLVPVHTDSGELDYILVVSMDISKRKRTEQELVKAKERAEESDRLKSAFLANMSHEIRTPMNGILGFVSLLEDPGVSGTEQEKYMQVIKKSGDRMLNTVNDLIEISKIEAGQVELKKSEVFPSKKIEELYTFFKPEFDQKGLEIRYSIPDSMKNICLLTDEAKLHSILMNLIKNAYKYTEKGQVSIGCLRVNKSVEFFVEDTGIGIPENRQKAIFDRFVQADIGDRKVFEGSGLGLSIAKSYVHMLGGEIGLQSKKDEGTVFRFTIPLETVEPDIQESQFADTDTNPDIQPGKEKPVILIVEDDDISCQHLEILLQRKARKILHAGDGREAVEISRKHPEIDLILMDIKIPLLNGYESTKEIRQFNSRVRIIAQTAHALEGDKEKALEAGCNDYITKPISKEVLFRSIDKVLQA